MPGVMTGRPVRTPVSATAMGSVQAMSEQQAASASMNQPGLLLVDDDPLIRDSISYMLRPDYEVYLAETRAEASDLLRQLRHPPPLALIDLGLPPYPHDPDEGFALVAELMAQHSQMRVLALSGQDEPANLRHAFALGAADFVCKPCDPGLLKARLQHQLMLLDAEADAVEARDASGLLGNSAAMTAVRDQVEQFADAPFPVLIEGESGTGKELVARRLHETSARAHRPFVPVNCAAFTETLLEAQLFGHARGAFTGAQSARPGFFEEAGEGTLFLDEIGEMPLELQSRLLRVIESGEFYRVGETRPRHAAARVIAATNKSLTAEVEAARFRQDLYYRLGILPIEVPPLRERAGDALALLEHFQSVYQGTVPPFTLSPEAQALWEQYPFPGNVRELRNVVIRLGTRCPGATVTREQLERELDPLATTEGTPTVPQAPTQGSTEASGSAIIPPPEAVRERLRAGDFDLDDYLEEVEKLFTDTAQEMADGNQSRAARLLGVNRTTLYGKIQRLRGR